MAVEVREAIVDTEFDREDFSVRVKEAFISWYRDPANEEAVKKMDDALKEAYREGVRISVQIAHGTNGSTPDVNEQVYNKLVKSDPRIQEEIVISSFLENHGSKAYIGEIIAGPFSSFLSLDVVEDGKRLNFTNLKPDNIILFTPIINSM